MIEEGCLLVRKGITIDIDPTGETVVVVPADQVDETFIAYIQSDEYVDWLEEAHDDDVDFPYNEPIMLDGKEYNLPIYRVPRNERCKLGEVMSFTDDQIIEELRSGNNAKV